MTYLESLTKGRDMLKDNYKEVRIFEFPNMICRVHIPDLAEEERTRRMKMIEKAAADLLLDVVTKSKGD